MNREAARRPGASRALRAILWTYIILCLAIAGLNYGYAPRASPRAAALILRIWQFYENWIKTAFILAGSFLTLRIVGESRRTSMRKRSLVGFIAAALVVHVASPLLLGNGELYFFAMPLPWTTAPLQLLDPGSSLYRSSLPAWGAAGISAALIFYLCVCAIVLSGTLLFGRRWQCSTLCLFNGFAAEVFAPAIPLVGSARKPSAGALRAFSILRRAFLAIAALFCLWWILRLTGAPIPGDPEFMAKAENYKYLGAELLTAMFFWVAYVGRGYCLYCPLGTAVSWLGRLAGQRIDTDRGSCIRCGRCNEACPVAIDVRGSAASGRPVREPRCLGCGHCVDACPARTLAYSTAFLRAWRRRRG